MSVSIADIRTYPLVASAGSVCQQAGTMCVDTQQQTIVTRETMGKIIIINKKKIIKKKKKKKQKQIL